MQIEIEQGIGGSEPLADLFVAQFHLSARTLSAMCAEALGRPFCNVPIPTRPCHARGPLSSWPPSWRGLLLRLLVPADAIADPAAHSPPGAFRGLLDGGPQRLQPLRDHARG